MRPLEWVPFKAFLDSVPHCLLVFQSERLWHLCAKDIDNSFQFYCTIAKGDPDEIEFMQSEYFPK